MTVRTKLIHVLEAFIANMETLGRENEEVCESAVSLLDELLDS